MERIHPRFLVELVFPFVRCTVHARERPARVIQHAEIFEEYRICRERGGHGKCRLIDRKLLVEDGEILSLQNVLVEIDFVVYIHVDVCRFRLARDLLLTACDGFRKLVLTE